MTGLSRLRGQSVLTIVSEKEEEHNGDKLMTMLGFTAIRFSQPRNTMQSRGISDRLYIHETKRLAVFWEAKTERGKQSLHQARFQQLVESQGWEYVVGPLSALVAWCEKKGLVLPQGTRG